MDFMTSHGRINTLSFKSGASHTYPNVFNFGYFYSSCSAPLCASSSWEVLALN